MTHRDVFGQPVGSVAPAAVAAFDRMCFGFLAHAATTPAYLADALRLDPDFALAHACRGLFSLTLARRRRVRVERGSG